MSRVQKQSVRKKYWSVYTEVIKYHMEKNCYNLVYLTNCFHKTDPAEEKEVILLFICL